MAILFDIHAFAIIEIIEEPLKKNIHSQLNDWNLAKSVGGNTTKT